MSVKILFYSTKLFKEFQINEKLKLKSKKEEGKKKERNINNIH